LVGLVGGNGGMMSMRTWVQVQEAAVAAAEALGLQYMKMVSRAYHDSLFMAQVAPTGMIFIPCRGGWSHRPDEYASPQHIEDGVKVLALTLARLSTAPAHDTSELWGGLDLYRKKPNKKEHLVSGMA
jgi:Peptidase family M20/M25/M40